jgi:carboxymethylenebutenolidase
MATIELPYFLSLPDPATRGPGVVVIHEGGGISTQLLRFCQRLAGEGYGAVAPDLFFRSGGTEAADYATLIKDLVPERLLGDVQSAADVLRQAGCGPIGVMGFCMGGRYTWYSAVHGQGFEAAVGFYGSGIADDPGEPTCPTLLFFGGDDPWISPEEIQRVVDRHPETVVYPQATHGFMRDGSPSFDEAAASDAWTRTLAFFDEHLGRSGRA